MRTLRTRRGVPPPPPPTIGLPELYDTFRPGDLVFTGSLFGLSGLLLAGQTVIEGRLATASHVAICIGPGLLAEAVPKLGVRCLRVEDDPDCQFHRAPPLTLRVLRLPGLDEAAEKAIWNAALYYLGQDYTFRYFLTPEASSGAAFCSQFAMQVLDHAKIPLPGRKAGHLTTPDALLRTALGAGALDVTAPYREVSAALEHDASLREAFAEDAARLLLVSLVHQTAKSAELATSVYAGVRRLSTAIADMQTLMFAAGKRAAVWAREQPPPPPLGTVQEIDLIEPIHTALVATRMVLCITASPNAPVDIRTTNWLSEHMPSFSFVDQRATIRNSLITLQPYAGVARDVATTIPSFRKAVADTVQLADKTDISEFARRHSILSRSFSERLPLFSGVDKVSAAMEADWPERPATWPPDIRDEAAALIALHDSVARDLLAICAEWFGLLADMNDLIVVAARLTKGARA